MLFVMLLSMMERYLTVFVRAAEEIHLAKISRSIARPVAAPGASLGGRRHGRALPADAGAGQRRPPGDGLARLYRRNISAGRTALAESPTGRFS